MLKDKRENCGEPQHMLMRVSVGIHLDDLESVLETS
jgi:ribonucleoside-diphosphate reductase alpha chain